ncbi:unnamed protein product [uncultured bacterium]|nr:unnamed protein product [uncultured bacterium]
MSAPAESSDMIVRLVRGPLGGAIAIIPRTTPPYTFTVHDERDRPHEYRLTDFLSPPRLTGGPIPMCEYIDPDELDSQPVR